MSEISKEEGVLAVLAKRLVEERLPKALALKQKVDQGEVLADSELAFLEQVMADVGKIPAEVKKNPKYQDAAGRMVQLYKEITTKALENEKGRKQS